MSSSFSSLETADTSQFSFQVNDSQWRAIWSSFWANVATELESVASDNIADEYEPSQHELIQAEAMIESFCLKAQLDVDAWFTWIQALNARLPDLDEPMDTAAWPRNLPVPPEEPEKSTQLLLELSTKGKLEGWAASWILYHLAIARVVRDA